MRVLDRDVRQLQRYEAQILAINHVEYQISEWSDGVHLITSLQATMTFKFTMQLNEWREKQVGSGDQDSSCLVSVLPCRGQRDWY